MSTKMKRIPPSITAFTFFMLVGAYAQEQTVSQDSLLYDVVIRVPEADRRMKYSGNTRLTINQAHFENWISGGESSLTALFGLDYNFNYSDRNGIVWDSNLILSIGTTAVAGNTFNRKADDRLELKSLVGIQLNQYWNLSASASFKTQMFPGYRYYKEDGIDMRDRISRIFSPAIAQAGMGWYFKKSNDLRLNLSPLTSRLILVSKDFTRDLDDGQKYFGVDSGQSTKFFFGAAIDGYFKTQLMENITMENTFNFYVNYLEKIGNIDVDWNANFRFKVNDKVSGNLILHIQYDDDLIQRLQLRELFGVGISIDI